MTSMVRTSCLRIVTSHFPYGDHDEFMSEELGYLARAFDEIILTPLSPRGSEEVWDVPTSVSVDTSLASALSRKIGPVPPIAARWARRTYHSLRPRSTSMLTTLAAPDDWTSGPVLWAASVVREVGDYATIHRWALLQSRPSVTYTFWLGPATAALANAWAGVPVVSRAHGGDLYAYSRRPTGIPLQTRAIDASWATRSVSRHGAEYLRQRHPTAAAKIGVSHLGIRLPDVLTSRSGDGLVRVLSASSVDDNKRVRFIHEVVRELQRLAMSPIVWTHFGDGPAMDDLRKSIAKTPVSNLRVDLVGRVPVQHVRDHFAREPVDLFINASRSEGMPISVMEAQSFGVACLAPDVGGVAEVAPPSLNAIVTASSSPRDYALAGVRLLGCQADQRADRRDHFRANFEAAAVYGEWSRKLASLTVSRRTWDEL